MPSNRNKIALGQAFIDLEYDVRSDVARLCADYRRVGDVLALKQAVDTPRRVRAQVTAWISSYNAIRGANAAQTLITESLTAAGSALTLAQIDARIATIEAQAQTLVNNVSGGWTWNQVASAIEGQFNLNQDVEFSFRYLPVPTGYTTIWGDPW